MSKYDFGFELEDGSTNEWAYGMIRDNTKVLEIGPAVGNLTYHLSTEKKCVVDIVEIDEEAGRSAKRFARKALIGTGTGDLNKDIWYEELKDEKYNYIVILDVLEHLQNPEQTLRRLKMLLTEDGKFVLSIPNVAHNAVIYKLVKNRFDYTELGLLDRTHIYFFTYYTIMEMIGRVGLNVVLVDAIKKTAGDTEIECDLDELPVEVEHYLKTREYGDVYQYLLVLEENACEITDNLKDGILKESLYDAKVLINGLSKNIINVTWKDATINFEIDLNGYDKAESFRFVPVEHACLISDLCVYALDQQKKQIQLRPNWVTGVTINEKEYILTKEQQEMNFLLTENVEKVVVNCTCRLLDGSLVGIFQNFENSKVEVVKFLQQKIDERDKLVAAKQDESEMYQRYVTEKNSQINELSVQLQEQKQEIENQRQKIENQRQKIENQRQELENQRQELDDIKKTRWYKIAVKVKRIIGK